MNSAVVDAVYRCDESFAVVIAATAERGFVAGRWQAAGNVLEGGSRG